MELYELVQEYISEKCDEAMAEFAKNPDHKARVGKMNVLFDAVIKAHHESRRNVYLYIADVIENYFKKGFYCGMEFLQELYDKKNTL